MNKTVRIVLTGPSCSGKTTLLNHLAARCPDKIRVVPEVATLLLSESTNNAIPSDFTPAEVRRFQLDVYSRQVVEESRVEYEERIVVLDRGTVDGAAYWPGGAQGFWSQLDTSQEQEFKRYTNVIWLDSVVDLGEVFVPLTNEYRNDSAEEIALRGQELFKCWQAHPSFSRIPAYRNFQSKISALERLILQLAPSLSGCLSGDADL